MYFVEFKKRRWSSIENLLYKERDSNAYNNLKTNSMENKYTNYFDVIMIFLLTF